MAKPPSKPAAAKKAPAKKPATTKKAAAGKKPAAAKKPEPSASTKAKLSKAIEEAKSNASALTKDARAKAEVYREQIAARGGDWAEDARDLANQARDRATELALEGKAKTSDALANIGKIVADNASTIDEKLGTRYGDYARTAARTMQETAANIEAKDLAELGDEAKQFVRQRPGVAIGIAAAIGFFFARLFKGGGSRDA